MIESYKGYLIQWDRKTPNVLRITVEGDGGKLPNILKGLYTSRALAKYDIDKYLGSNASLKEKVSARKTAAKTAG